MVFPAESIGITELFSLLWLRHIRNPTTTDLRKGKVIMYNFVYCIHRNCHLFRNVLYCIISVSKNDFINWFHHFSCAHYCGPVWSVFFFFFLNTFLTFFKQFRTFVNIFVKNLLLRKHHRKFHLLCTTQSSKVWCQPGATCSICRHFE